MDSLKWKVRKYYRFKYGDYWDLIYKVIRIGKKGLRIQIIKVWKAMNPDNYFEGCVMRMTHKSAMAYNSQQLNKVEEALYK